MTDIGKLAGRFESIFAKDALRSPLVEDKILFENEHFAVVPSLGSLVPGWVLIVAKRQMLNCSHLSAEEVLSLHSLTSIVTAELGRFPGEVFIFEHGASRIGNASGCGVDQAHLHLVPLNFDLLASAFDEEDTFWRSCATKHFASLLKGVDGEYTFIFDPQKERGILGVPKAPVSQWVRRIIAKKLSRENEWDYKTSPNYDFIRQTVSVFSSAGEAK